MTCYLPVIYIGSMIVLNFVLIVAVLALLSLPVPYYFLCKGVDQPWCRRLFEGEPPRETEP